MEAPDPALLKLTVNGERESYLLGPVERALHLMRWRILKWVLVGVCVGTSLLTIVAPEGLWRSLFVSAAVIWGFVVVALLVALAIGTWSILRHRVTVKTLTDITVQLDALHALMLLVGTTLVDPETGDRLWAFRSEPYSPMIGSLVSTGDGGPVKELRVYQLTEYGAGVTAHPGPLIGDEHELARSLAAAQLPVKGHLLRLHELTALLKQLERAYRTHRGLTSTDHPARPRS